MPRSTGVFGGSIWSSTSDRFRALASLVETCRTWSSPRNVTPRPGKGSNLRSCVIEPFTVAEERLHILNGV
jgi:hypothetical protein